MSIIHKQQSNVKGVLIGSRSRSESGAHLRSIVSAISFTFLQTASCSGSGNEFNSWDCSWSGSKSASLMISF